MISINPGRVEFRRFARPRFVGRGPGLHPTNVFNVKLMELDGEGLIVPSAFNQTGVTPIPILLFVHDEPALIQAFSRYADVRFTDAPTGETYDVPNLHFLEDCRQDGDLDAAPYPTVFTGPEPDSVGPGELVRATTLTNAVDVSGYASTIRLLDQSLVNAAAADVQPLVSVFFVGKAGTIEGPNSAGTPQDYEGANTNDPETGGIYLDSVACILREQDYTQAMADGTGSFGGPNTFTAGTVNVRVVGLHAIPALP